MGGFLGRAFALDLGALQPRAATISVLAIAACLGLGLLADVLPLGMVAVTGALTAGFGAFQQFTPVRSAPMVLASVLMAVSGCIGSALGAHPALVALASALAAASCGVATQYGQGSWWLTLQGCTALFVAAGAPSSLEAAAQRGLLILAGGLLQCLIVAVSWRLLAPFGTGHADLDGSLQDWWSGVRGQAWTALRHPSRQAFGARYAGAAAIMTAAATLVEQVFGLSNGYWVPMTALIILKPQFDTTATRTAQRVLGTLVGGTLATLIAATVRPTGDAIAAVVLALAWLTYAAQRVNYALFTACITATVVFLLALRGLPAPEVVWFRIVATLIGAALAIVAGLLIGRDRTG